MTTTEKFWKYDPEAENQMKEKALALGLNLDDLFSIPKNSFYTEEDLENAVKEILEMEDELWIKKVRSILYVPHQRTTNNRKKKQRRKYG